VDLHAVAIEFYLVQPTVAGRVLPWRGLGLVRIDGDMPSPDRGEALDKARIVLMTREMMAKGNALVIDVRDAPEVEKSGKVRGAVHVSRGMLEFRADPETPYHDKNFTKDKVLILYCASGGRSALAGKVLKEMGYSQVYNLGAFKDWAESGEAVDKPIEPGM
jgi:rhodanese-related sulfurtransferase